MPDVYLGLPVLEFAGGVALCAWSTEHHTSCAGIGVRVGRAHGGRALVDTSRMTDAGLVALDLAP